MQNSVDYITLREIVNPEECVFTCIVCLDRELVRVVFMPTMQALSSFAAHAFMHGIYHLLPYDAKNLVWIYH